MVSCLPSSLVFIIIFSIFLFDVILFTLLYYQFITDFLRCEVLIIRLATTHVIIHLESCTSLQTRTRAIATDPFSHAFLQINT